MIPERRVAKPWALFLVGLMVLLGGCILFLWPWLSNFAIDWILNLRNSLTQSMWTKNPIPIFLEFFLFNWTNPSDLYNPHTKPHFTEVGPFVFEETKERVNITWNDNNTVTYKQKHTYFFREDMSIGPLSINITTVNAIAASASYIMRDWNFMLRKGFDWSLRGISQEMYTTKTAGEFTFYGYTNPLIFLARTVPNFHGIEVPKWDKFAWFYKRNDTSDVDGIFNVYASGESLGHIKNWNYEDTMSKYTGECDKVKGAAGELFGPNRKRDYIGFFSTDICRYIQMDYVRDQEVDGINGYRYELGDGFFATDKQNSCYCSGSCAPYGAVNVSSCKFGAPGFVSRPHFQGADPYYTNHVDGMMPDKKKHEMFMVVEPRTGIPLEVEARLQLNVLLERIDYVSMFEKLPREMYLPVLWIQQKAKMPRNLTSVMKVFLNLPIILKWTGAILLCIGIPLLMILLYKPLLSTLRWRTTRRKNIKLTFSETECGLSLVKSTKAVEVDADGSEVIKKQ